MSDWEEKVEAMARATAVEDVRILAGVPSWMSLVTQRVLEVTGKSNLREVAQPLALHARRGGVQALP